MQNKNEFNILTCSENNNFNNENNVVEIVNLYKNNFKEETNGKEFNLSIKPEIRTIKKVNNNNYNLIKLAGNFVAVLAMTATVQTTIQIPVFSEIFQPQSSIELVKTVPLVSTYSINDLISTQKSVTYNVTLDNIEDFSANEYSLMLVKSGCDNDEYVASILKSVKNKYKIIVSSNLVIGTFTEVITQSKIQKLTPNTEYVLLVLKDDMIVHKKAIKTEKFQYITSVEIDAKIQKDGRHIYLRPYINSEFTNYDGLYIKVTNLTTNEVVPAFSILYKSEIDKSINNPKIDYPQANIHLVRPEDASIPLVDYPCDYKIQIFCSTPLPEDSLKNAESFVKDEIVYYLIYTHESAINI